MQENKILADYFINLITQRSGYQIAAHWAAQQERKELFSYIKSLAPNNYKRNYDILAVFAADDGNKGMFDYILLLALKGYNYNWNIFTEKTCK